MIEISKRGQRLARSYNVGVYRLKGFDDEDAKSLAVAEEYLKEQRINEAIQLYKKVVERRPDKLHIQLNLANLYYESNNYREYDVLLRKIHDRATTYFEDEYHAFSQGIYYNALKYYENIDRSFHDKMMHDIFKSKLRRTIQYDMQDKKIIDTYETIHLYSYVYSWLRKNNKFKEEQRFIADRMFASGEDIRKVVTLIPKDYDEEDHYNLVKQAILNKKGPEREELIEKLKAVYLVEEPKKQVIKSDKLKEKLSNLFSNIAEIEKEEEK